MNNKRILATCLLLSAGAAIHADGGKKMDLKTILNQKQADQQAQAAQQAFPVAALVQETMAPISQAALACAAADAQTKPMTLMQLTLQTTTVVMITKELNSNDRANFIQMMEKQVSALKEIQEDLDPAVIEPDDAQSVQAAKELAQRHIFYLSNAVRAIKEKSA